MTTFPSLATDALGYRARLLAGDFSARQGIERYLALMAGIDSQLSALLESFPEDALTQAREIDSRIARGEEPRALEGIPFTVKGNMATTLGTTTAGSRILEGFRSPYTATAVERLTDAGAILVAKTNLDEFAMGSSCENSAYHLTRNPYDRGRVPGGSSGGAAALAGALGWGFHLGSDTGGSIRQPAGLCGASGMKPTYGRVSRWGLLAFGSSLDQIGPLARTARDVEAVLEVMAGPDELDATTTTFEESVSSSARPRRVGLPREYFGAGIEPEVEARVREAGSALAGDGVELVDVSLPHTKYANACYQLIATAEASSNLARYDGVRYGVRWVDENSGGTDLHELYRRSRGQGFGAEVKRRILLGTFVLSAGYAEAYYQRATRVRRRIREDFDAVFQDVDALLAPTSPFPPFRLGERVSDPLALYACDVLTVSANLAGGPGISIPCGLDSKGLPVGLQILGPRGGDARVLGLARRYQELTAHHETLPEGLVDAP